MLQSGNGPAMTVNLARDIRELREPTISRVGRQQGNQIEPDRFPDDLTRILVTSNARGFRPVILMRASCPARVAIRKPAPKVRPVRQPRIRLLFKTNLLVPSRDGTFETTTPHLKV
jgi:hypothetical protein